MRFHHKQAAPLAGPWERGSSTSVWQAGPSDPHATRNSAAHSLRRRCAGPLAIQTRPTPSKAPIPFDGLQRSPQRVQLPILGQDSSAAIRAVWWRAPLLRFPASHGKAAETRARGALCARHVPPHGCTCRAPSQLSVAPSRCCSAEGLNSAVHAARLPLVSSASHLHRSFPNARSTERPQTPRRPGRRTSCKHICQTAVALKASFCTLLF